MGRLNDMTATNCPPTPQVAHQVRGYCAFVDALGFSRHCLRMPTKDALEHVWFLREFATAGLYRGKSVYVFDKAEFQGYDVDSDRLAVFQISDAFVMFTFDESPESFESLLNLLNNFFCACVSVGYAIRAGVTVGNLAYTPDYQMIAGDALAKAAIIEKRQKWLGVVFDPSMPILAGDWPLIRRYGAPVEDDPDFIFPDKASVPCLNWPSQMKDKSPHPSLLLRLAEQEEGNPKLYRQNACLFYDAVKQSV